MSRSRKNRIPKSAIAIVGEGQSEWHYFTAMKLVERFPFKVSPELPKHSDVDSIIKLGLALVENGYDRVYCVIDLDIICQDKNNFEKYQGKKSKAIKKSKSKLFFIESMPCIELWFLIHFTTYSTKAYLNYNEIKPELRKYIADYEKSVSFFESRNFYDRLIKEGSIENATIIAAQLSEAFTEDCSITFPRTSVHELVEDLKNRR